MERLRLKSAFEGRKAQLQAWRRGWEYHANRTLERAGHAQRIDHRTLAAQGIDRAPTHHLGPAATEYERRTHQPSRRRLETDASRELAEQRAPGAAGPRRASEPRDQAAQAPTRSSNAERARQTAVERSYAAPGRSLPSPPYPVRPAAQKPVQTPLAPSQAAQPPQPQKQKQAKLAGFP